MSDQLLGALGARIRGLREASGVSQEAFAAQAGMDRAYLGKIERGAQNISILTAARIAHALGVTLSTMLEGVPKPGPDDGATANAIKTAR